MRPAKIQFASFLSVGRLPGRIGPYNICPNGAKTIPLKIANYGVENVNASLRWEHLADQLADKVDQLPRLRDQMLRAIILPQNEEPAALLVRRDQLAPEFQNTVDQMIRACQDPGQAANYLVLVPRLAKEGKSATCFNLAMAGVDAAALAESNLANHIAAGTPLDKVMFVNIFSADS